MRAVCLLMALLLAAPALAQAPPAEAALDLGSEAEAAYLALLERAGTPLPAAEAAALGRHLARLALLLPEDLRARVAEGDLRARPGEAALRPGAGDLLAAWWRSRDPLPATPRNERLAEHLDRLAYADEHFAYEGRATGLDDRGEIYLRYGEPTRRFPIRFDAPRLIDAVYRPGVTVSPSDFPENEFWIYRHIDRTGYFLFVERDGHFQLAETADLLPSTLRYAFPEGERGEIKAQMALAVLRSVYEQLAVEHIDFATRFNDVDAYARQIEAVRIDAGMDGVLAQARQNAVGRAGTGRGGQNTSDGSLSDLPSAFDQPPRAFVQSLIYQGQSEDQQAAWRRETTMPQQYTEVLRAYETLPVALRLARFLDDDGTTRTEIYWSPAAGGLPVAVNRRNRDRLAGWSTEQYLVALTVAQKTDAYYDRAVSQTPYLITDLPAGNEAAIPTQQMTVRGDTGRYHLALQWDQYLARVSEADGVRLGPKVKIAIDRADSLTALSADPARLEMSDLRPVFVRDVEAFLGSGDEAAGTPYPHDVVWPEMPLALYFEAYHLAYGADDQTHYRVAYEVTQDPDASGLRLRRRKRETTSAETTYSGQSRTAREFIMLDLSGWRGQGAIEVRVRVTDLTTGQEVVRTLAFTMQG